MTLKPKCWVCEATFTRDANRFKRYCSLICGLELNYLQSVIRQLF
jgi:hypothetical protein